MDLSKFRIAMFEMVKTWSIEYTSEINTVNFDAAKIELPMWTNGYQFAKSNQKITSRRKGNKIIYRSSVSVNIDDSTNWPDFDSFKQKSFNFHDTTFNYPTLRENWLQSECDCGDYFKQFTCAHIIGIAIRLKCVQPPVEAKTVPIGEKRKRGRPGKAKSALTRQ